MADFNLGKAYVEIKSSGLDKLQTDIKKLDRSFNKISVGTTKALNSDFRNATRTARGFGDSIGRVGNLLATMPARGTAAMSTFTGSLGTASSAMGGLSLAATGATAGIAALVGAGAGLVKSVRVAADLESRLAEVATISNDVAKNIKGVSDEIGKLSISTRTDQGLLAEGLYQTISAGITNTADALKFLEVSANAARGGLSNVGTAVSGLTSAVSAFGLQASDVGEVADKFFTTVRVGKLRFEDIASSIGSVAPLAAQLGISLDELLAAGSALTLTGQTLSESFTNIQGVMNAVLRPTGEAVKLAEELGLEFSATALRTKGLTQFLSDLQVQVGGDIEVMGQLFGRIEGLRGVLALTGNQAESFAANLNAIENAAGATDKAVAIQNQTFNSQIDLLKNQLSNVLRTIGGELLPDLTASLTELNTALEKVDWAGFKDGIGFVVNAFKELLPIASEVVKQLSGYNLVVGRKVPDFDLDKLAKNAGVDLQREIQNIKGIRVDLPQPPTIRSSTATPTATAEPTALQRAIKQSKADLALLNKLSPSATVTSTAAAIASGTAIQQRGLTQGGRRSTFAPIAPTGFGFGAGVAPSKVAGITRAPIPGVSGELVAPGLGIADPTFGPERVELPHPDFSFPTTLPDDLKTFADAVGEMPKVLRPATEELGVALGQDITPLLKQAGENLAGNFALAGSAIEGFATGGPIGALISAGTELLSMTEGFQRISQMWNNVVGKMVEAIDPLVSAIADALQPVFEALAPVFDALREVVTALTPWFKLLGQILKITLVPFLKILGAAIKGLAIVIRTVVNGFISIINGVINLINKIPGVDIKKVAKVGAPQQNFPDETRVKETAGETSVGGGTRDTRAPTRGIQISQITGPTRDIFVDLLRPLRNLDTTFPAMLTELRNIREVLTPGFRPPNQSAVPNAPTLRSNFAARQDFQENANLAGGQNVGAQQGRGGIVINELHINVQQIQDIDPVLINEHIQAQLDLNQRGIGVVFPVPAR